MRQVAKFVVLQVLRGYKWALSPLFPPACRFVPTCSEYAMEAVERFGAVRGGAMALVRLLRCHPFAGGGYDPVPQRMKRGLSTKDQSPHPLAEDARRMGHPDFSRQSQSPHFSQSTREMGHPDVFTSGEQSQSTI